MRSGHFVVWTLLLLAGILSGCRADGNIAECHMSSDNPCDLSDFDGPTLVYPGGRTRCAFDDYQDAALGVSLNSTYFFQVLPGYGPHRSKLLIFFQGGGSCVNAATCSFAMQCMPAEALFVASASPTWTGIFNTSMPDNYFAGYTIVQVTYCTGDLHVGNFVRPATTSTATAASSLLSRRTLLEQDGMSSCLSHSAPVHHVGYWNARAVLSWTLRNVPSPSEIVVAGFSAGSLGAQFWISSIAYQFRAQARGIPLSVIADSFVGIEASTAKVTSDSCEGLQVGTDVPANISACGSVAVLFNLYNACTVDLRLSDTMVMECQDGSLIATRLVQSIIRRHPYVRFAFLNHKEDDVQRAFYSVYQNPLTGYLAPLAGPTFYTRMILQVQEYGSNDNVVTLFTSGLNHGYLIRDDDLYNQTELGFSPMEWLTQFDSPQTTYGQCGGEQLSVDSALAASTEQLNTTTWCSEDLLAIAVPGITPRRKSLRCVRHRNHHDRHHHRHHQQQHP